MRAPIFRYVGPIKGLLARVRQLAAQRAPEALSLLALLLASACEAPAQRHPAAAPGPRTTQHLAEHQHGKHDWYWADSEDD